MDGRGFKFSLLFGIVTCFLSGTGLTAQNSPPTYVNGLRGRSALLPIDIPPGKTVAKIKWDFCCQTNETNQIAEISNGTLNCTNACGRFGQRLEMVSETALRINDLEMEDSGVYNAHVRFNGNVYPKYSFNLTVYEPQITHELTSSTPDGCNVTLQCQVSGKGDFRVSWKRGDPLRALDESLDWHQLSDNGSDLHLFWHRNASDANFTCLVSNQVDQKNISINLLSICPPEGANPVPYAIAIICLSVVAIAAGLFWKRKTLKPKFRKVFCHRNSTPNETELQEVVALRSVSVQNGYSKCACSEPDNISDSIHPPGPLENC